MNYIALIIALIAGKDEDFSETFEKQFLPDRHEDGLVHTLSDWAYNILDIFGLQHNPKLALILYSIMVLGVAIGIGVVCRWVLLNLIQFILSRVKSVFVSVMVKSHFLMRFTALVPPLAYIVFLHLTYLQDASLTQILSKITIIYIIFVSVRATTSFVNVVWVFFDRRQNKRKLPLKSIAQLINGVLYLIATIIVIGIIVNKSPATLLAGLGAFAAVLMLIFKDSILGVVASVQLSEEDALHVGDWIKVPGTEAYGTVIEANLSSIKVLNWDKTTTFVPPHSLISGSFTNYRSMQESNARRIYQSFFIDADSVRLLNIEELKRYSDIPFMKEWIDKKLNQKQQGIMGASEDNLALGSTETNLGLLRAYMKMYLDANPDIDHNQMCMIGSQPQTSCGIPVFVYCFAATSIWNKFLAIQASVIEHLIVILQRFDLCTYEAPSGRDTIAEGYLSAGHPEADLFGAPEPFFYRELDNAQNNPLEVNAANRITADSQNPPASTKNAAEQEESMENDSK